MTAKVSWKVTGHRVNQDVVASQIPDISEEMNIFGDILAEIVGNMVYNRIAAGEWHTSTNPSYQSWRAYLHATGSTSRNPRRKGSRNLGEDEFGNFLPGDTIQESMDRLKFNFLIRVMGKANKDASGNLSIAPPGKRGKFNTLSDAAGVYNVESALKKAREIRNNYNRLLAHDTPGSKAQAQNYMRQSVTEFLNHGDYTKVLRETRLGQRIMRQADAAAVRMSKSTGVYTGDEAVSKGQQSKAVHLFEAGLKTSSRSKTRPKVGGRGKTGAGGGFKFGYQTGTFADSWRKSTANVTFDNGSFRISLVPSDVRDESIGSTMRLTERLKDIISDQRGNPQMVRDDDARKAVREALVQVQNAWAEYGIRIDQRGGPIK